MIRPGDLRLRAPVPGESLDGFVADIVGDNDLRKVRRISSAGGVAYGHRPTLTTMGWRSLPILAPILEVDLQELEHRSYPSLENDAGRRAFFGTTINRLDLRTRERFFSPAALARSSHHRAMWQLRLPYDVETGELLVSRCPRTEWCGKVQRWQHSAGVRYCDACVKDLSEQTVPIIDKALLPAYSLAAGLTHTDAGLRAASLSELPEEVAALGADMAFELLIRLVPVANNICGWSSRTRIWANEPHQIALGMHGAWHILKGWPHTMTNRVTSDLASGRKRHDDGNGGANRRFLTPKKAEGLPACIRKLVEGLVDSLSLDGSNGERVRATTYTAVETSAVISLGTKELVDLRRAGTFRTIAAMRGGLLVPLFDRAEVHRVAVALQNRLDLDRLNGWLGLPYYAIEQLAAHGNFAPPDHPFFRDRYAVPQTTRAAFDAFVDALLQRQSMELDGAEPLKSLMRMVGGCLKPWGQVVEAMLGGTLPFTVDPSADTIFGGVHVESSDLRRILGIGDSRRSFPTGSATASADSFTFSTVLTKRDCAEVLNVSERAIVTILAHYPKSPVAIIPVVDVEALAQAHITAAELSARLGITPEDVHAAATSLGIGRSSGAGYDMSHEAALMHAVSKAQSFRGRTARAASPRSFP